MKLTAFNPLDDLLQTDEEIALYLRDAYQDDDPSVFIVALGHVIKHKGVAKVSEETGLTRASLYKTIGGKVQPKWDTVHRLLKALHVKLDVAA